MTEETTLITDAELKAICQELDQSADESATLPFITAAHLVVFEQYDGTTIFNASRLKLIELYLAAHFAAITNPVAAFEGVGKLQQSVQYKVGLGLSYTKYGQQALLLSNGTLLGKRLSITWLGMHPED